MSVALVIMCDGPDGCGITAPAFHAGDAGSWENTTEYRQYLATRGWRRTPRDTEGKRLDLCPGCTRRRGGGQ